MKHRASGGIELALVREGLHARGGGKLPLLVLGLGF